jgi:CheY-like chemotaxis protein
VSANADVLVVDDEVDIRETLQTVLEMYGYKVSTAKDGIDALAQLQQGARPGLILLDLMMPNMSGSEFRVAQLEDPALAHIPVIVVSGDSRGPDRAEALRAEVLTKPIDLRQLVDLVEQFCNKRPSSDR